MLTSLFSAKWSPVELIGWTRRAYGRKIFLESEGGTLTTTLKGSDRPEELHLNMEISGRMLILAYCNEVQILDELISHGEFDSFINLSQFSKDSTLNLELHLIPATFGEVKIHQSVSFFGANPVTETVDAKVKELDARAT